jgi:hypothetical protein
MGKVMDVNIERISIIKVNGGFFVETYFANGTTAAFSVDGYDLELVFHAIEAQNKEIHDGVA